MNNVRDFRKQFFQYLVQQSSLRALVSVNIYPAFLALVHDPSFPCINYEVTGASDDSQIEKITDLTLQIWVSGSVGYDQLYDIYAALKLLLNHELHILGNIRCFFKETGGPIPSYDPSSKIFSLLTIYTLRVIS